MNNKKIILLVLILTVCLTFAGCAKHHKISSSDNSGVIVNYPKSAVAGQTVTVQTAYICDGVPEVYFNREKATPVGDNKFEFVMPEENVDLTARVVSDRYGA